MNNLKCPCCGGEMVFESGGGWLNYWRCDDGDCAFAGPNNDTNGDKVRRLHYLQDGEVVVRVPKLKWKRGRMVDSETAEGYLVYVTGYTEKPHRAVFNHLPTAIHSFDTNEEAKAACEEDYRKQWLREHDIIRQ